MGKVRPLLAVAAALLLCCSSCYGGAAADAVAESCDAIRDFVDAVAYLGFHRRYATIFFLLLIRYNPYISR